MKKRIILFFAIFIYLQQTTALNLKKPPSKTEDVVGLGSNCRYYINDNHIVDSFPFTVHFNPITQNSATTFALMNTNGKIEYMKIINKKYVPSLIYCLKHLSKLEIVNTSFSDAEQRFQLGVDYLPPSLTHLRIYNTTISHLPDQIGKLKRLQILKLSNTGLMSLPDSIGNLSLLKFLFLPHNNLTSLPVAIRNLRSLQQITLFNNSYLRSVQPLNDLPSLRILDTRYCSIELIPQNLPRLTDLYMSNNNLTKLTYIETLGNETDSKKVFYFDQNHIRSMSPRIQYVRNLYRLNLYHNELYSLPTDIFNLTTLSYLNIKQNHFHPKDLKLIISKFHDTNPKLNISYK